MKELVFYVNTTKAETMRPANLQLVGVPVQV